MVVMGAACAQGQAVAHTPAEFLAMWGAAWQAHDVEGIMRLHAEDCVTVNRFGSVYGSKAETAPQMAHLHNGPFKGASFPMPKLLLERTLAPGLIEVVATWQNPALNPANPAEVSDMVFSVLLKDHGAEGLLAEQVDLHNVDKAMVQRAVPGRS